MTGPSNRVAATQNRLPTTAPTTARQLAFAVLDEYQSTSRFAAALLDAHFHPAESARRHSGGQRRPLERRFATELVLGLIRRRLTLDTLIESHVSRPRHRIEGPLWTLLQMGVYQLIFMDSVPFHAAVHETVELSRWLQRPRWSGFLNGVLRSVERSLTGEFASEPAADAVPVRENRFRKLNRNVFCDPDQDCCGYLSQAFSLPRWLLERWQSRSPIEELIRVAFWSNEPPKIHLRVNRTKIERSFLLAALADASVSAASSNHPDAIKLDQSAAVPSLPGFEEGWFTVQDESALSAGDLLAPRPEEAVLDLCAAPGTKTTHLAELMQNRGSIVATDVSRQRLERVEQNVRRLDIDIIQPRLIRSDGRDVPAGPFDAILVDVPCSNTGVLAKRPEARWRIRASDSQELRSVQMQLLQTATSCSKPNGRIVYSTCSIEPEENQQLVRDFCGSNSDWELVHEIEHIPGRPADGGYQALLRPVMAQQLPP